VYKAVGDSLVGTYGPAPVTQLSPGVGVATLAVPNLAVNDYYVIVRADPGNGYYTAAPSTLTRLTVYQPAKRSAIGVGWVSDGGRLGTFGFTVAYNTKATAIIGSSLYVYQDGALIYTVLSNAWTGLAFTGTNKASFQGKANVKTYNPATRVTTDIGGDFAFVVSVVDNGSRGDTYQITVYDKSGLLYHQTGARALSGGNIVVSTR